MIVAEPLSAPFIEPAVRLVSTAVEFQAVVRFLAALLLRVLALAGRAIADERIFSFDSDVTVQPDGTFIVTETIRVNAEGRQIRQGIFSDFPILQRSGWRNQRTRFELFLATRNGEPEVADHTGGNAVRVYLAQDYRLVPRGESV